VGNVVLVKTYKLLPSISSYKITTSMKRNLKVCLNVATCCLYVASVAQRLDLTPNYTLISADYSIILFREK